MGQQEENIYANFKGQLEQIGDAISRGIREDDQGDSKDEISYLGNLFENILIHKELLIYADRKFYNLQGLKYIDDESFDAPEGKNKVSSDRWLIVRTVPNTISLLQALFIDWRTSQISDDNIRLCEEVGIEYAIHPGPQKKKKENRIVEDNKDKWKNYMKEFDKIRSKYPEYFPAFFVLVFLFLKKDETRLMRKLIKLDSRGNCQESKSTKDKMSARIAGLAELKQSFYKAKKDKAENDKSEKHKAKEKSELMREYIAMVAFLALMNEIKSDETAIANIVCLEEATGLCSALFSKKTIRLIVSRKLNWRKCLCNSLAGDDYDISQDMLENCFYYMNNRPPDPIISKIRLERVRLRIDRTSDRTKNYSKLASKNISLQKKLDQLTIWQFRNFDLEYCSDAEYDFIRNKYKRKTLEKYFGFRKRLEAKTKIDQEDWQFLVSEYIAIMRNFIQECDGDYEEEEIISMTWETQRIVDEYNELIREWYYFFIVRRRQNGEKGELIKNINENNCWKVFFHAVKQRIDEIPSSKDENKHKAKKKKDRRTEKVEK